MNESFPVSAAMVARSRAPGEARWSPNGRHLGWVETAGGQNDIVVAPADGSGPPIAATVDAPVGRGGSSWAWLPDGETIVYAAGDGRLLTVPAVGGPVTVLSAQGRAAVPAVSPDGGRVAFMIETKESCEIAVVPADGSAWPVKVSTGADWAFDPAWSADGGRLAWLEWDFPNMAWDSSRIVVRALDGLTLSGPASTVAGGDGVAVGQPRFSPDGRALAFISDQGGWANVWVADADGKGPRPVFEDDHEHAEATWSPGQRSYCWSPDSRSIALCRNEDGFGRLAVVSVEPGSEPQLISKGWHHGLDWGVEGIACVRSGGKTPPQVVVMAPDGSSRRTLALGVPGALTAAKPPEPQPVSWTSGDGATVHGLLYRPQFSALGPDRRPPLLVYVHGGPTGMTSVSWWPRFQFWVSRGWAILAPNYRGSTGYGRAYAQALTSCWGEVDVGDVASGIRHATESGWCEPDRVAIDGGSAGGLTLLLVCAHHPGLVRAAIDRYGVTDLFDLAETTHRLESRYLDMIVGPLPQTAERYRDRSPINHVERITTPLLVLQGDNDEVVPKAQADTLVEKLRAQGSPVEYHVYEGEGHGWNKPETMVDELARAEKFLTRWVLKR